MPTQIDRPRSELERDLSWERRESLSTMFGILVGLTISVGLWIAAGIGVLLWRLTQ